MGLPSLVVYYTGRFVVQSNQRSIEWQHKISLAIKIDANLCNQPREIKYYILYQVFG